MLTEGYLTFRLSRPIQGLAGKAIRKAVCAAFPKRELLSQHHATTGACIHRYPRIQYRVHGSNVTIYGVNEGVDELYSIYRGFPEILSIPLDYQRTNVVEAPVLRKHFSTRDYQGPMVGSVTEYKTVRPLLLIDTAERRQQWDATPRADRPELMSTWIINSMIHICHDLNIALNDRITIRELGFDGVPVKKKGIPMEAHVGILTTNFMIRGLALGRFTSHGFGEFQLLRDGGGTHG